MNLTPQCIHLEVIRSRRLQVTKDKEIVRNSMSTFCYQRIIQRIMQIGFGNRGRRRCHGCWIRGLRRLERGESGWTKHTSLIFPGAWSRRQCCKESVESFHRRISQFNRLLVKLRADVCIRLDARHMAMAKNTSLGCRAG